MSKKIFLPFGTLVEKYVREENDYSIIMGTYANGIGGHFDRPIMVENQQKLHSSIVNETKMSIPVINSLNKFVTDIQKVVE